MAEIKPEEVSAILREQLAQTRTDAELEEVGTVLTLVMV
jgi:F-type H+-transporting ATPase subunit alpha